MIIPHGNARDIEELPDEVRAAVRFHPVKTMDEVLALALATAAGGVEILGEALCDSVRTDVRKDPGADPLVIRSLEFLGGMASATGGVRVVAARSRVRGTFERRQIVAAQPLVRRKNVRAREQHARAHARDQLLQRQRPFMLVDLPGYGYARISKEKKAEWKPLIESYMRRTTQLRGIVLLLDIRREPSDDDRGRWGQREEVFVFVGVVRNC